MERDDDNPFPFRSPTSSVDSTFLICQRRSLSLVRDLTERSICCSVGEFCEVGCHAMCVSCLFNHSPELPCLFDINIDERHFCDCDFKVGVSKITYFVFSYIIIT